MFRREWAIRLKGKENDICHTEQISFRCISQGPSLNDSLETGPPIQNFLWSVLVRNRLKPVALCGDIKKVFLQVQIQEADHDTLRFHWIRDRLITTWDWGSCRLYLDLCSRCFFLRGPWNKFRNFKMWIPKACGGNHEESLYWWHHRWVRYGWSSGWVDRNCNMGF